MRRVLLVCVLLVGCEKGPKRDLSVISMDDVPPPALKAAQTAMPEVKFDTARKMANGGYELFGKNQKGKIREVEVSAAGEILQVE
jgi:hypothetical protein